MGPGVLRSSPGRADGSGIQEAPWEFPGPKVNSLIDAGGPCVGCPSGLLVLPAAEAGTWHPALGSGLTQTTFGSKAYRVGWKTSGSVIVKVWHFSLTPQTAVVESPGTQRKASFAGLALHPLAVRPPGNFPPAPPATDLKATYSPPWPLTLGFSPAPVPPQTRPQHWREENSKSLLQQ